MIRIRWALPVAAAALGCATTSSGSAAGGRPDVIGRDVVARSAAGSVWQLLRTAAPRYSYVEDRYGRAVSIRSHRGPNSIALAASDMPMVVIDGARLTSLPTLQQMPVSDVDRIELLSGITGTITQGTNAGSGVIYIHTRFGPDHDATP